MAISTHARAVTATPTPQARPPVAAAASADGDEQAAGKHEESGHNDRGKLAAITGGAGAGLLFFRDRIVQGGQVALSLPRVWNDPTITMSKPKWLSLWGLQLVTAENSNAIVKPSGDLKLLGHTFSNGWGKLFKLNHGLQVPVMGMMLASVIPNAKGALDEDGPAGMYDTRSGRTAVVSALEGGYLAIAFSKAAATAKGQGAKAMMHAAIGHESMGGTKLFVMMMVAENALVANEIGWLDFLGHKDTDEHKPIWKALTGIP
jgi:hypothetical protein